MMAYKTHSIRAFIEKEADIIAWIYVSGAAMCEVFQHILWMKFGEILHSVAEVEWLEFKFERHSDD